MLDPVQSLLKEPFTRLSRRYLKLLAAGEITAGELIVLLVIADKTISWQRLWTQLSFTDLQDATGMSRKGLGTIIERLGEADLIVRKSVSRSFAYALVPKHVTAAQLLEATVAQNVDNSAERARLSSTSGNHDRLPQVDDPAVLSFVFKKGISTGSARAVRRVDKGLSAHASSLCERCHGEGWIVLVAADGFTESVARCPCTT